jgi:hypothetical protein
MRRIPTMGKIACNQFDRSSASVWEWAAISAPHPPVTASVFVNVLAFSRASWI